MEIGVLDRYGYIEKALKETGLVMVESVKRGRKTVITVTHGQKNKTSNFHYKQHKEQKN